MRKKVNSRKSLCKGRKKEIFLENPDEVKAVESHPKKAPVICPTISVDSADYADCNGVYSITGYVVLWAVLRPVYKHRSKDR